MNFYKIRSQEIIFSSRLDAQRLRWMDFLASLVESLLKALMHRISKMSEFRNYCTLEPQNGTSLLL